MNRTTIVGTLATSLMLLAGCGSEVPVGRGTGAGSSALGNVGEPPKSDGTCATRLTVCNGICGDVGSDDAHCGACGTACTGSEQCASGTCTAPPPPPPPPPVDAGSDAATTCADGKALCGGTCVDTLFDGNNCGACGTVCAAPTKCLRATCM